MLDSFTNYFWQHPVAVAIAAIATIIILVWMTGSGSRHRFITFKRSKETDQLARDLSRIAAALEKIAQPREMPMDYLDRPVPQGWAHSISPGAPVGEAWEEAGQEAIYRPAAADHEAVLPAGAPSARPPVSPGVHAADSAPANPSGTPKAPAPPAAANAPRQAVPDRRTNPLGGTADLLAAKKKLDLPNPLYRPKR